MSEPHSLTMRVTLTETSFSAFMSSSPVAPREYTDWPTWLKARKSPGEKLTAAAIERIEPPPAETISAYLTSLDRPPSSGRTRSHYDAVSNSWSLIVQRCPADLPALLQLLGALRRAAFYKDLPGDDYLLLLPQGHSGVPDLYVTIGKYSSTITPKGWDRAVEEANLALGTLIRDDRSATK